MARLSDLDATYPADRALRALKDKVWKRRRAPRPPGTPSPSKQPPRPSRSAERAEHSSATFFGLYREHPFQIYFTGEGFRQPKLDETATIHSFRSRHEAEAIIRLLSHSARATTLIAPRTTLRKRMRTDHG